MAEARIPVDLFNPGQVFACLGLLESAEVLLGEASGGFDWTDPARTEFRLRAQGADSPVAAVLAFLARAEVRMLAPKGSTLCTKEGKAATKKDKKKEIAADTADNDVFPSPAPSSPATLPATLSDGAHAVVLDYWADATRRDNVKFWAGMAGYPGAALARDALALLPANPDNLAGDPFAFTALQSSSFRFDWRRDYIPIDAGFSPNKHNGAVVMTGYPLVEILAAIGLSNARPLKVNKLSYRYATAGGQLYPPPLLRAALGAMKPPFPGMPLRHFRMSLDHPGKDDRAITDVIEETET